MKPSEAYIDVIYETLEVWFRNNLSPSEAGKLVERMLSYEDHLVPRILELTKIELRRLVRPTDENSPVKREESSLSGTER